VDDEVLPHSQGARDTLLTAIVPSLRVDVLGARAFKVSRAYFAKGVAAGRVSVAGKTAGKSTTVESGDVVVANGLGSFTVVTVDGLTRKGNAKVTLSVTARP
jgi:RNA-binding protein YlmH